MATIEESATTTAAPARRTNTVHGARYSVRLDPLLSAGFIVLLLAMWQGAVAARWIDGRLWPSPTVVVGEMWTMTTDGELHPHIWATLSRVLWAFVTGGTVGVCLGLAMGMVRPLRAMLDPVISILSVMPKIAILPLVYLAFGGYGETPRTVTVAIAVFAVVTISAMGAVRTIDGVLMEAGRNFGANPWQMFRHVLLPGSLPAIFSGLRVGLATALLVVIAAEFSYTKEGLGFLIWSSWNTLATTRMFVGLISIAVMGLLFTLALNVIERVVIPWKKPS